MASRPADLAVRPLHAARRFYSHLSCNFRTRACFRGGSHRPRRSPSPFAARPARAYIHAWQSGRTRPRAGPGNSLLLAALLVPWTLPHLGPSAVRTPRQFGTFCARAWGGLELHRFSAPLPPPPIPADLHPTSGAGPRWVLRRRSPPRQATSSPSRRGPGAAPFAHGGHNGIGGPRPIFSG